MIVHLDKAKLDAYLANVAKALNFFPRSRAEEDLIVELRQQHIHITADVYRAGEQEAELLKVIKFFEALNELDKDLVQEALDNAVLDIKEHDGSNVNNEGYDGQIRFLAAEGGLTLASETVKKAIPAEAPEGRLKNKTRVSKRKRKA